MKTIIQDAFVPASDFSSSDLPQPRSTSRFAVAAHALVVDSAVEREAPRYTYDICRYTISKKCQIPLENQGVAEVDKNKKSEKTFDQDAFDLENWALKLFARKLLWKFEQRDKRRMCEYQEIFYHSDLVTKKISCRPHADPYSPDFDGEDWDARLRFKLHDVPGVKKLAAVFRVVNCSRQKISRKVQPEIWYCEKNQRASFHKVQVCGSVWTCPTCSRKINLARQKLIVSAYEVFSKQPEYDALMITFTIRHGFSDKLADTLEKIKTADRKHLQKSYAYEAVRGRTRTIKKVKVVVPSTLSFVGRISTTEMTHGRHGWHPHLHQLWFFDRKLTELEIKRLRLDLFREWKAACLVVGLDAPIEFVTAADGVRHYVGVDVRRALSAADYLTKFGRERLWGPEKEMAASHSKKAKKSGRSPFQILFDAQDGEVRDCDLFRDYAHATLGRHQLEWSALLKKRLVEMGMNEIDASDQELADAAAEDSRQLGELDDAEFEAICRLDSFEGYKHIDAFGQVLKIAKHDGFQAVLNYIHGLPSYQ